MNTSTKPIKTKVIEVILTIATVITIFITIGLVIATVEEYRDRTKSPYSESSFEYALAEHEYGRLMDYAMQAEVYENPAASVKKYFGISDYFYASTMENLARTMSDPGLEDYWRSRKNEATGAAAAFPEDVIIIDQQYSVK